MKRTSGRIGVGLVLVSLLVGACMTDRDKGDTRGEVSAQPEAVVAGSMVSKNIVVAVRSQLERAFGGTNMFLPEIKRPRPAWHAFDDVGTKTKIDVEFLGDGSITGERGKVAANIALPARADGVFRLRDEVSGVAIDVGLEGATASAREDANGYVVYPGGYANGAHIVHRPTSMGTEDYVFFAESLPQTSELRYKVKLGDDVAGLRFVEQTVEMLDAGGAPRLRMAPPYAVDGDGRRLALNVAIEGCAYDTSLALPWDRPTVNPGARECTVRLRWPADAKAPLVVDPVWQLTGDMVVARHNATAQVVPLMLSAKSRIIVVGGDQGPGTAPLNTTEVFDDSTNTWTAGPSLINPRTDHAMVGFGPNLHVIGGRTGTTSSTTLLNNSEKLGVDANGNLKWTVAGGMMGTARARPTVIAYDPGRIFATGGLDAQGQPLRSFEVYDPAVGWAPGGGMMTMTRVGHAMVSMPPPSGTNTMMHVLIMGGKSDNGTPTASVERCWQLPGITGIAFECSTETVMNMMQVPIQVMKAPRVNHLAIYDTAATARKVHVFGGDGLDTAECYNPPANAWGILPSKMSSRRAFFTATQLGTGSTKYVVVGGLDGPDNGGNPQATTDFYDTATETFTPGPSLVKPRARHTATYIPDRRVIVAGGAAGNVGTAEMLHCSVNADCPDTMYCANIPNLPTNIGICKDFKPQGAECNLKTDCWGGECEADVCADDPNDPTTPMLQCVDGYCCNSPCADICAACDNPGRQGTCAPIAGDPHGGGWRGECVVDDANSKACAGKCDGFVADKCAFPAGKPCRKECAPVPDSPQSTLTSYTCDEEGFCSVATLDLSCGNYTCNGSDACNMTCNDTDGNDCITGYRCNAETHSCVEAQVQCGTAPTANGPDIDVVESVTQPPNVIEACNGFKCDPITVQCLNSCSTAYDCTTGFTCDSNHACVPENFPSGEEIDDTISCSVSPSREASGWGWFAALAFAGALASRRNRSRA